MPIPLWVFTENGTPSLGHFDSTNGKGTPIGIDFSSDTGYYVHPTLGVRALLGGSGSGGLGNPQLSCSDLTSDIEPNLFAAYFRASDSFSISTIRASLINASVSGVVEIGITVNGSNILSTNLTIDAGELTSLTAASSVVISSPSVSSDADITIQILQAGVEARGLIVTFIAA